MTRDEAMAKAGVVIGEGFHGTHVELPSFVQTTLSEAIAAALLAARDEALEEAAKMLDEKAEGACEDADYTLSNAASYVRDMKSK